MTGLSAFDVVKASATGEASKVTDAVNSVLGSKVEDALAVKRIEIARKFIAPASPNAEVESQVADMEI